MVKGLNMRKIVVVLLLLFASGCAQEPSYRARALPEPRPETPVVNIPRELRVKNWLGNRGEGSCVHATTKNVLVWLNDIEGALNWNYENGEWSSQLQRRLREKGYEFEVTENASDYSKLEWASDMRLPAIIWWKPSHCCMFAGFSLGADVLATRPDLAGRIDPRKEYAAVLDNNYIDRFEYTEKQQFVRLWIGYGAFAVVILGSPTTSIPWQSYEVIE